LEASLFLIMEYLAGACAIMCPAPVARRWDWHLAPGGCGTRAPRSCRPGFGPV